jgi:hypothetical protein
LAVACPLVGSSLFSSSIGAEACRMPQLFCRLETMALAKQGQQVDLLAAADRPNGPDLRCGGGTGGDYRTSFARPYSRASGREPGRAAFGAEGLRKAEASGAASGNH